MARYYLMPSRVALSAELAEHFAQTEADTGRNMSGWAFFLIALEALDILYL